MDKALKTLLLPIFIIFLWFLLDSPKLSNLGSSTNDLLPFWAASKLFLEGGNPYDFNSLRNLMLNTVPDIADIMQVWNPPQIFSFIAPIGLFEFNDITKIWFIFCLCLYVFIFFSFEKFFQNFYKRNLYSKWFGRIFVVTMFPLFQSLALGQLIVIPLFGLSMYLLKTFSKLKVFSDNYRAGFLLSLTLFKPHLLTLLYLFLLLRSFKFSEYRTLIGLIFGAGVFAAFPLLINPDIYSYYFLRQGVLPLNWINPTTGAWLMLLISSKLWYLRFLPLLIMIAVLIGSKKIYYKNIFLINFLLIALSLCVAPYAWTYDFVLLIPCALFLIHSLGKDKKCFSCISLILLSANILICLLHSKMYLHVWYPIMFALLLLKEINSEPQTLS